MAAPQIYTTATVLDLARARRSKPAEQTPDEVASAWAKVNRAWDEKYRDAVMRILLADLATWPRAFQRIGEQIQTWGSPEYHWHHFRDGRERGTRQATPATPAVGDCRCGCAGFTDELALILKRYRAAAAEVTGATKPAVRQRRRDWLDRHKRDLLRLMWEHGARRIDRRQVREHLTASAQAECRDLRGYINGCSASIREAKARLRENRAHNRHGPTDRPLSPGARLAFEREITEAPEHAANNRARLAHLESLLLDPFALARERTGCQRVAVA